MRIGRLEHNIKVGLLMILEKNLHYNCQFLWLKTFDEPYRLKTEVRNNVFWWKKIFDYVQHVLRPWTVGSLRFFCWSYYYWIFGHYQLRNGSTAPSRSILWMEQQRIILQPILTTSLWIRCLICARAILLVT